MVEHWPLLGDAPVNGRAQSICSPGLSDSRGAEPSSPHVTSERGETQMGLGVELGAGYAVNTVTTVTTIVISCCCCCHLPAQPAVEGEGGRSPLGTVKGGCSQPSHPWTGAGTTLKSPQGPWHSTVASMPSTLLPRQPGRLQQATPPLQVKGPGSPRASRPEMDPAALPRSPDAPSGPRCPRNTGPAGPAVILCRTVREMDQTQGC